MQAVTIKTLATALNLSTATVSKALSDSYDISEETKQRVRKLAEELHYVPDLYASSLRKRKSKTIGKRNRLPIEWPEASGLNLTPLNCSRAAEK